MIKTLQMCLLLLFLSTSGMADTNRRVEDHYLISDSLPAIRIAISKEFHFLGSFPFRLQDIAAGKRMVFIDGTPSHVRRMFIAQFEGFLPESTEIYRYSFDNAILLGGFRFRQNTFSFSFQQSIKEDPHAEAALTKEFLQRKKYAIGDEWMCSRFLTLGDESRKNEMILFYMEPIGPTGYHLEEFYKNENPTEIWQKISKELDQRSRSAFRVVEKAN